MTKTVEPLTDAKPLAERTDEEIVAWVIALLYVLDRPSVAERIAAMNLRSHEPPRNSGEGTAVNGPMPLGEKPDAVEQP